MILGQLAKRASWLGRIDLVGGRIASADHRQNATAMGMHLRK